MSDPTMASPAVGHVPASIPSDFMDLADYAPVAALTTVMPDGSPQTSVVWCDVEGPYVRINTMRSFRKEKNMRANPHVTLFCYDPAETLRYMEVRGTVVEMTEVGAMEHLDGLSMRYAGVAPYFGKCIPESFRETETPVLCRILPTRVLAKDWRRDGYKSRPPGEFYSAPSMPASAVPVPIPESHLDLLTRPVHGVLTTMMPDGQPQSSLVWVGFDGECALVNTTLERQKGRNLTANPKVSLLVVDPSNTARFIQVRGLVELVRDGAIENLDELTRKYSPHPRYYGFIYPVEQQALETRVICRIHATRITLDAIHA
jgi:PPOX class probable F420-dependent enzyme